MGYHMNRYVLIALIIIAVIIAWVYYGYQYCPDVYHGQMPPKSVNITNEIEAEEYMKRLPIASALEDRSVVLKTITAVLENLTTMRETPEFHTSAWMVCDNKDNCPFGVDANGNVYAKGACE